MTIITLAFFLPTILNAQSDTTKITQYCEMIAQGRILSTKITIDIDFGEGKNGWSLKSTKTRDEVTGKIKKFKSTVDALNYLGAKGWKLLNAFPITETSGFGGKENVLHFFFEKSFDRSEMVETPIEN